MKDWRTELKIQLKNIVTRYSIGEYEDELAELLYGCSKTILLEVEQQAKREVLEELLRESGVSVINKDSSGTDVITMNHDRGYILCRDVIEELSKLKDK